MKTRVRRSTWRYLMRHHKHMFVQYRNATLVERFIASKSKLLLESIAEGSDEKILINLMINNCCSFIKRPIIRHVEGIEESLIDRRSFGGIFKAKAETSSMLNLSDATICQQAYEDYSSNRLRGHHFWNAIKTANEYVKGKSLPPHLEELRLKIELRLRMGEDEYSAEEAYQFMKHYDKPENVQPISKREQTFQVMKYHDKLETAKMVSKYVIGVMSFCYQYEKKKVAEKATSRRETSMA